MSKRILIYILEYPISNWVNDELDEIKKNFPTFRYTTIGQFYKKHPDSQYFCSKKIHYAWTWIQIIFNPLRYLPILKDYRKEVGLRIVIQTIALTPILRRFKDITIHCHFASSSTTAALILNQLHNYPFSFTAHAWDIYFNSVNKRLLQKKIESAYYVRTISEYNKQHLSRVAPNSQNKMYVIHCGIRIENFSPHQKAISRDAITIISASNFVEKKGYIPFIESFKNLNVSDIPFHWKIAGRGPLQESIKNIIKENELDGYIELIPPIPHEKLNTFFDGGDLFFLPCTISSNGDRDGIPVILMEAMATGIITISTPVSGIPELIKNKKNGFLLSNNSVNELIKVIHHIKQLSDTEINTIQNNARKTIECNYNIRNVVKEHLKLIYNE